MLYIAASLVLLKGRDDFMKKLLGFALIVCVLITSLASVTFVSAADVVITENDGRGTVLVGGIDELASAIKNCSNTANSTGTNKNWSQVSIADIDDPYFDKAILIESRGTTAKPGTNQVRATFETDGIEAGEYIYVSFYYRALSELNGTTYTDFPQSFSTPEIGKNSGRVRAIGAASDYSNATEFDKWYKVSYVYPITAAVSAGNTYLQLGFAAPSAGLPAYAMEVAGLNIMTFGIPEGPSADIIKNEVISVLDTADFSSVKFGENEIDLATYPAQYSESIYWNGTLPEITGTDINGKAAKVEYDGDSVPQTVKVTAYAMDYDVTSATDTRKKEYFVNIDYYRASTAVFVGETETTDLTGCVGGEEVKFDATIYNPNGETADYTAVMGIYSGKKCIAAIPWKISVTDTDESKTGTFTYTLPARDYTGCEIRTYVISPLRMYKVN